MELLLSLNSSAIKKEVSYKKFADLPIGSYTVKKFALKETSYGIRLSVYIEDFYLTLPQRYSDKINTEAHVEEMNRTRTRLIYGGKEPGQFGILKIDFKVIEPETAEIDLEEESQIIPSYTQAVPPSPPPAAVVETHEVEDDDDDEDDEEVIAPARNKRAISTLIKNVYPSKRSRL